MIALVSTGGTIAGRTGSDGSYAAEARGSELLEALRSRSGDIPVELHEHLRQLSFEITLEDWLGLVRELRKLVRRRDVTGIVVVQGTALLEEVPFLTGLFVPVRKGLVFTGAMTPADRIGSDGPGNVLDALAVARDPGSVGRGPLVVMNRRVIAADRVIKRHRGAPDALTAADGVSEGAVDGAGVRWLHPPRARPRPWRDVALERDVPLLSVALGETGSRWWRMLEPAPAALVVEGFPGGGGVPLEMADPLIELASRIPVVLSARSPEGRLTGGAGGRSGGGTLTRGGLLSAHSSTAARARLVAMAALAHEPGRPHAAVREALERWNTDTWQLRRPT
jgi:L-asparaginase